MRLALVLLILAGCAAPTSPTAVVNTEQLPTPTPSVTLTWDASASPNVTGYRIYMGLGNDKFTQTFDVGNALTFSVAGLLPLTQYEFAATCYDDAGDESDFSNKVYWISNPSIEIQQARLNLTGTTGWSYDIQQTATLTNPTWTTFQTLDFDETGSATIPVVMDKPAMFFRVKKD